MFKSVKQILIQAMMLFGCNLSKVNPLKCISMNNQECKIRPEIVNVMLIVMSLYFILLVMKLVNALAVVTISMIHMLKCVFLMLSKT